MPIEQNIPNLDTRSAEEIFEAARQLIPLYAPDWTDYNESDPGITLLQLFAWLTETMLYRMNQVPLRLYLKFLKLLNVEQRAARPATAHLTLSVSTPAAQILSVPQYARFSAQGEGGQQVIFETTQGIDVIPLPLAQVLVYDGAAFRSVTAINQSGNSAYSPFGGTAQEGAALYLGFTPPPVNSPLSQHFPPVINFRVGLPPSKQTPFIAVTNLPAGNVPPPPVQLVWEYRPPNSTRWQPLTTHRDESAAFTREGYIQVEGPEQSEKFPVDGVTDPLIWLRCRMLSSAYPVGQTPQISFIRPNVVAAENLASMSNEILGESNGEPDQTFTLRRQPVRAETLRLYVQPANLNTTAEPMDEVAALWERQDDFLDANPQSRCYTLNPTTGEVKFGNGKLGRIPPAGMEIFAASYRYGGGVAGNVRPNTVTTALTSLPGVQVTNERPGVGGSDEQPIDDLIQTAPKVLRSRNRAMSDEDFTWLVQQIGGIAQAKAFGQMHPDHRGVDVPGAVTVLIVPDTPDNPPTPSDDLLQSVARYLNPMRLITTELYVSSPYYRAVEVEATILADPYASPYEVEQAVQTALKNRLDPKKWKFGDDLYPTNLYNVILGIANVRAVDQLQVRVDKQPLDSLNDAVRLRRDELVYSVEHIIHVRPYQDR